MATTGRSACEELLERIERRWTILGAPVLQHLQPGLTDAQMDAMSAEHNLVLGDELRAWWGWHDGSGSSLSEPVYSPKAVLPRTTMFSLTDALTYNSWIRTGLRKSDPPEQAELLWRRSWLRPLSGGLIAVCRPEGPTALLRDEATLDPAGPPELFPSMQAVLTLWAEALDLHVFALNGDGTWEIDAAAYGRHPDIVDRLARFIPV